MDLLPRAASIILNTILAELFTQIHSGPQHWPEVPSIQEMILRESQVTVEAAAILTYLYCVHKGWRVSAGVISFLLCLATSEAHLDTCLKMVD